MSQSTSTEVDQAIARISKALAGGAATLRVAADDIKWLLAEIEGGREAFGTIVGQKNALRAEVANLRRTIQSLQAMIHKERR